MAAKKLIIALSACALASCAAPVRAPPPPLATPAPSFCDTAAPLLVDARDRLTPATTAAILAHNKAGAALCGWGKK